MIVVLAISRRNEVIEMPRRTKVTFQTSWGAVSFFKPGGKGMKRTKEKSRYLGWSNHEIGCELESIANTLEFRSEMELAALLRHVAARIK